jgi:hypothetical protein
MRYAVLVILNLPVILIAFINILAQYKMHKISRQRFWRQVFMWFVIFVVLIGSFPLYNHLNNKPIFDSSELSLFDIAQTTAVIFLIYAINYQRQQIERTEKTVRDLHQELSMRLSKKD